MTMDTELTNGDVAVAPVVKELKECSKTKTDTGAEESSFRTKTTESEGLQNGDLVSTKHSEEEAHKYNHEILQNGSMTAKSDLMSDEVDKVTQGASGTTKEKRKVQKEDHETSITNHDPDTGAYMMAAKSSSSTAYSHSMTAGAGNDVAGDASNSGLLDLGRLGEIKLSTKVTSMDDLGASFLNGDEEEDDDEMDPLADMKKMSSELRTERFVESTVGANVKTHMMGDDTPSGPETSRDLVKRILAESHGTSSDRSKVKISMGAEEDDDNVSGYSSKYSAQGDRVIGSERRTSAERSQSLFERRLESMGIEKELTDMMHPSTKRYDSYDSTARRPYSNTSDYGSLESDMENSRGRYSSSLYNREDGMESYGGARGRFSRQRYVDDYDMYGREQEPEEELLPDEDFEPQRRPETGEIVKEKTDDIRGMVDRQNNVVQKLRRASESFDELQGEIRALKQEFIESQARRSQILDDIEYEAEISSHQEASIARRGGYLGRGRGYGYGDYEPGPVHSRRGLYLDDVQPQKRRTTTTDDDDSVFSNNLGLATVDDDDTRSVYSSYTAERKSASTYGRSKSLLEDMDQDDDFSIKRKPIKSNTFDADDFDYGVNRKATKSRYDVDKPDGGRYGDDDDDLFGATAGAGTSSRYTPGSYTPGSYSSSRLSGGYSASGSSRYGQFSRSKTLNDADTDTYSSGTTSSGFSSRFLSKVRQDKATGEPATSASTKRDKPFKSRFLRSSFDTSDFATPSSTFSAGKYSSSKFSAGLDDDSISDISGSTADTAVEVPTSGSAAAASEE